MRRSGFIPDCKRVDDIGDAPNATRQILTIGLAAIIVAWEK